MQPNQNPTYNVTENFPQKKKTISKFGKVSPQKMDL
jgi:hypothetical protein